MVGNKSEATADDKCSQMGISITGLDYISAIFERLYPSHKKSSV